MTALSEASEVVSTLMNVLKERGVGVHKSIGAQYSSNFRNNALWIQNMFNGLYDDTIHALTA